MTSDQVKGKLAVFGIHTVIGSGLLLVSATICPPIAAVWWCHNFVAIANLLEER